MKRAQEDLLQGRCLAIERARSRTLLERMPCCANRSLQINCSPRMCYKGKLCSKVKALCSTITSAYEILSPRMPRLLTLILGIRNIMNHMPSAELGGSANTVVGRVPTTLLVSATRVRAWTASGKGNGRARWALPEPRNPPEPTTFLC